MRGLRPGVRKHTWVEWFPANTIVAVASFGGIAAQPRSGSVRRTSGQRPHFVGSYLRQHARFAGKQGEGLSASRRAFDGMTVVLMLVK